MKLSKKSLFFTFVQNSQMLNTILHNSIRFGGFSENESAGFETAGNHRPAEH